MVRAFLIAAMLLAASAARADMSAPPVLPKAAAAPKAVVTKLFEGDATALGQPLRLPQGAVALTVSKYEIPPGAALPVHKHPYPRYAYVLAGRLKVTTGDGVKSFEYGPGDVIVEMLDAWHSGATVGRQAVELLVIDQAPPGTANTVLQPAGQ